MAESFWESIWPISWPPVLTVLFTKHRCFINYFRNIVYKHLQNNLNSYETLFIVQYFNIYENTILHLLKAGLWPLEKFVFIYFNEAL